ncbi:MAG: heavy-metal-associated domain-containing protein [Candidatus Krumholzibacteria bacterium]|nr:heavy-metal-associated domain-containing protein [Candidatus Krumholzibacteria bacterium]
MIRIKIQGMTCRHCLVAVTKALEAVPGVTKVVEVDLERGEALVEGTPDPEYITYFVELAGYRTEAVT